VSLFTPPAFIKTGSFTPASFGSDLKLWLTADAGVTDAGGGAVSSWADQSGNGNDVTQGTSARRPTYSATGYNSSYPGITFATASTQYLAKSAASISGAAISFFLVMTHTSSDPGDSGMVSVVGAGEAVDYNNDSSFVWGDSFGGGANHNKLYYNNGPVWDSPDLVTDGANHRIGLVFDGAEAKLYVNNGSAAASGAATGTIGDTAMDIGIGGRPWNAGAPGFDGTLAEVVVVTRALDATERTSLDNYFTVKWGL
jgi:hypothetical protein